MTIQSAPVAHRIQAIASRITPDRRRHKRVSMTLLGRFMRGNKQEYPCRLIDISAGGAGIMSPVTVDIGEKIIAYFDTIGGVECIVMRNFEGGFGVRFDATQHRREKVAAQLTWLINKGKIPGLEERRHERIVPKNSTSMLKLANGAELSVQVLDVSISGASVACDNHPPVGAELTLGKLRGRVVRHHAQGIGIEFLDIQPPTVLRRYFS